MVISIDDPAESLPPFSLSASPLSTAPSSNAFSRVGLAVEGVGRHGELINTL